MDRVGLAVVGSTGIIGRVHIDAISQLDSCALVGITARRQEPLRVQARELGTIAYPTLDDALADDRVDAVVIATPHPSHAEITARAAEAGKHVLVEKPMGVTPSEADAMIGACRDARVKLGVLFNQRFRPEAVLMREIIDSGAVGKVYRTSMTSVMLRTQDYYDRLDWRGTWQEEGGGALLNQGIHAIDLLQWLGGIPGRVIGVVSTLRHRIEVEDFSTALLQYEGGGQGTLHCSTSQAPNHQRLEIWGENGGIVMDDWSVTVHRLDIPVQEFIDQDRSVAFSSPGVRSETFEAGPESRTHAPAIDDFARAIMEDREPAITGEDGLRSQEIVAAVTLSGHRGRLVEMPVDREEYDGLMGDLRGFEV